MNLTLERTERERERCGGRLADTAGTKRERAREDGMRQSKP